jgi:hypothetical protein
MAVPFCRDFEQNAFHLKSKVGAFAWYGALKDNTFHLHSRKSLRHSELWVGSGTLGV